MKKPNYKDLVTLDQGWQSLTPYGINPLTGEADAFSLRILCDLSQKGVDLMETFLGGGLSFREGSNWNGYVGEDESIASVMLPYSILDDLRRFVLFYKENKTYVHHFQSGQMTGTDEKWEEDNDIRLDISNTYVNNARLCNQPNEGGRNTHAATGRNT